MKRQIKVGDEVIVKFKVERITDQGRLCNYSLSPDGTSVSRTTVHPDDVYDVIPPSILVGEVYRGNCFDHKIESLVSDNKYHYAVTSIDGFIQTTLVPLSKIRTWDKV